MDHKSFPSFVTKVDDAQGVVEHLIAIMGNKDLGNDVIHPGAFTKTLNERGRKVRVLDSHKTDSVMRVLGKPITLREIGVTELPPQVKERFPTANGGLLAVTQFNMQTVEGRGAFERVKAGDIDEWSFGYDAVGPDYSKLEGVTVRNLREVKLYEYSPVIFGMNEATITLGAKAAKPWNVFFEDGKYRIYKVDADGNKVGDSLGEHDTDEEAQQQLAALYANEGKASVMKTEEDGEHPASHYLVVEDPEKVTTWHLRVRDVGGKPDHGLMGAAWAALHGGYRGQAYEGPGKQDAISKLTAMYAAENMDTPAKSDEKSGRRLKGDMVALIAEMQATLDKLAQWANYQDGDGGTPPPADSNGAPAEEQAAKTATGAQAGPSTATPTSSDALRQMIEIELETMEV